MSKKGVCKDAFWRFLHEKPLANPKKICKNNCNFYINMVYCSGIIEKMSKNKKFGEENAMKKWKGVLKNA